MKKRFALIAFMGCSILGHAKQSPFLFSSEPLVQEAQGSLKDMDSFVFFPLLKLEKKNAIRVMELINQELQKVGVIVIKPVLTGEGADLESFSNPELAFTIQQLVDQSNKPLPVLQASLSVMNIVEIRKNKDLTSLETNRWCVYLEKTNDVQKVIQKVLPDLLNQFIADFQKTHAQNQKPKFYISYDDSWWNPKLNKQD